LVELGVKQKPATQSGTVVKNEQGEHLLKSSRKNNLWITSGF